MLGGGWPSDVVKVEGDTVTLTFEMRSGREHNTPDRALWGFRLSVRAQEAEDTSCVQPATSDMALTLAEVISYSLEVTTTQHCHTNLHIFIRFCIADRTSQSWRLNALIFYNQNFSSAAFGRDQRKCLGSITAKRILTRMK